MKRRAPSSALIEAVAVTAELTGAVLSAEAARILCDDLARYPDAIVIAALARCRKELQRPLTEAAVLERLDDGHLGPDAAWALVATCTENDTVVWTAQIAQAWGGCRFLLAEGDRIQARQAFLETYRSGLAMARSSGELPQWEICFGYDVSGRAGPVRDALEAGRISLLEARRVLPEVGWGAPEPARLEAAGADETRSGVEGERVDGKARARDLVTSLTRFIIDAHQHADDRRVTR